MPVMARDIKSSFLLFIAFSVFLLVMTPNVQSESPKKIIEHEERIRSEMLVISKELGVTCTECHNLKNFSSPDKRLFQISREHIRIVNLLRESGFDGKVGPLATCYMCHRGLLKPEFTPQLVKQARIQSLNNQSKEVPGAKNQNLANEALKGTTEDLNGQLNNSDLRNKEPKKEKEVDRQLKAGP